MMPSSLDRWPMFAATLLLYSEETAAKSKSPCTWSESIGRIRFRPMHAEANRGHPSRTSDHSLES
jgi:hypothetical protein